MTELDTMILALETLDVDEEGDGGIEDRSWRWGTAEYGTER